MYLPFSYSHIFLSFAPIPIEYNLRKRGRLAIKYVQVNLQMIHAEHRAQNSFELDGIRAKMKESNANASATDSSDIRPDFIHECDKIDVDINKFAP